MAARAPGPQRGSRRSVAALAQVWALERHPELFELLLHNAAANALAAPNLLAVQGDVRAVTARKVVRSDALAAASAAAAAEAVTIPLTTVLLNNCLPVPRACAGWPAVQLRHAGAVEPALLRDAPARTQHAARGCEA